MMVSNSYSVPIGYKFKPTDEELLRDYLGRKLRGLELPCYVIVEMDVYAHEPWLLNWDPASGMDYCDRYYFVKREKKWTTEEGKTSKRFVRGEVDGGWWKATRGDKGIKDEQGRIVGYMKSLTFFKFKNGKQINKECIKTDWIMHEYTLPSKKFQEWVLCRIKYKGKDKEEMMEINNGIDITETQANRDMPLAEHGVNYVVQNIPLEQQQQSQLSQYTNSTDQTQLDDILLNEEEVQLLEDGDLTFSLIDKPFDDIWTTEQQQPQSSQYTSSTDQIQLDGISFSEEEEQPVKDGDLMASLMDIPFDDIWTTEQEVERQQQILPTPSSEDLALIEDICSCVGVAWL